MTKKLAILGLMLTFFSASFSMQSERDSTKTKKKSDIKNDTLDHVFKPTIGFEIGVLSFFGDVQNNLKGYSPFSGSYGIKIFAQAPLNNALHLEIFGQFNKITVNEHTPVRNLNFQSRIRMGGIMVHYNLFPLVTEKLKRFFSPTIGIGITSFEFNTKSDMRNKWYDYHYWSDGSIRNIAENDPNAPSAEIISRDNSYETDLRELNLDGLGLYRIQSWSVPITLGLNFKMGERFAARLSCTYHFTFTDLIDNVSSKGVGMRQGNKQMDNFLWTSFGLSYDLVFKKGTGGKIDEMEFLIDDPYLADSSDTDNDGIMDPFDHCAYTPLEASVDERGCPLDSDGDLVPDYIDEEPDTREGAEVNMYGVEIPEEVLNNRMVIFYDTTDQFVFYDLVEEQFYVPGYPRGGKRPPKKSDEKEYVVILDKEKTTDSSAMIHQYIGYENFVSIEKGDSTYYGISGYKTAEEAAAAKKEFEKNGVHVSGIGSTRETSDNINILTDEQIKKIETNSNHTADNTQGKVYRIQIGAFKKKVEDDRFQNLQDVVYAKGKDGYTRYYAGAFKTMEEANKYKVELITQGYANAFVVAYDEGERKTLVEAGANVSETYDENQEKNTFVEKRNDDTKKDNIRFKVFLGEFEGNLPTEVIEIYQAIGNVQNEDKNGKVAYYTKNYKTLEEAQAALEKVKEMGVENPAIFGDEEGKTISKEEAIEKSK
ncbi:MAG: SPOR domain-containing protein [Crocinitomicaceae bacterium]|nr:SPOR domain-containing protein [Crocinitomicaceae bacterium]